MPRDEKLFPWETHKTPKQVAAFMREEGAEVGRQYETHGDVWDAPYTLLGIGLLHLILDELEHLNREEKDFHEKHREWLSKYQNKVERLIGSHQKQCARISVFCSLKFLRGDVRCDDIHRFSRVFRQHGYTAHFEMVQRLERKITRMRQVKSLDDIEHLEGIGNKTADHIRARMAEQKPA